MPSGSCLAQGGAMCLISFQWRPDAPTPLVLAANRDEFYALPTQPLQLWPDGIVAGKDTLGGGTWLGLHQPSGRLAALTNYRDPSCLRDGTPSRGTIVTEFLRGKQSAVQFVASLVNDAAAYNPFNLLLFDGHELVAFESRLGRWFLPEPGIWAVSNADFNTPWPKVRRLRSGFAAAMQTHGARELSAALEAELWALLADNGVAQDADLPHTGVSLARERAMSPAFIRIDDYGTRCSTLVHHSRSRVDVVERSFDAYGARGTVRLALEGLAP
jgi:uncharacterized protein with NRDE domain